MVASVLTAPSALEELANLKARATKLYIDAWGQPWPRAKRSLSIRLGNLDSGMDTDVAIDSHEYECLLCMNQIRATFFPAFNIGDTLVILDEYDPLIEVMTMGDLESSRGLVVTGQPGIGKTTFLLYFLLHRLERKQPTAIQLDSEYYFIFDARGAEVIPISKGMLRLQECWALVDSNANVTQPCLRFRRYAIRVIQTTSPRTDKWHEWIKQSKGQVAIMGLPTIKEIAAIVQENGYDPSRSPTYVEKWGPSICTTLNIMRADSESARVIDVFEQNLTKKVMKAADAICADPSRLLLVDTDSRNGALDNFHSDLIFVDTYHPRNTVGYISWEQWELIIPTDHLADIFEQKRVALSNQASLDLFMLLSRHALTRSTVGWTHEMKMHTRICTTDNALNIFGGANDARHIHTSGNILPGSLSGLTGVGVSTAFYWMPQAVNFEGIDSVLGTADGEIYVLQATIATEHKSPIAGLKKLWNKLPSDVRSLRKWNVVFVTDKQGTATHLLELHSQDTKLGKEQVSVVFWGCHLNAST